MSFITRVDMSNKLGYLSNNIRYVKCGNVFTKIDIHECINVVHQNNAEIVSLICMLKELNDTRDDFKIIHGIE